MHTVKGPRKAGSATPALPSLTFNLARKEVGLAPLHEPGFRPTCVCRRPTAFTLCAVECGTRPSEMYSLFNFNFSVTDLELDPEPQECLTMANLLQKRRHIDLFCSALGFLFSTVHLCILFYIRYWEKRKGFFLLFSQAILSILTLVFLLIGCLIDICLIKLSREWIFFRAYLWLFIVNSLIAAYGFLIVVLCIDRYIALNKPLYYRLKFVRVFMVFCCILLAMVCCIKWLVFNHIEVDNTFSENELVTRNIFYVILRTAATIMQYFVSGVVMVILSVKNALKLRALDKSHFNELRMSEGPRNQWTRNHKTIANICIFLAFSYIVFNWPYAMTDYFYTDELFEKQWYGIIELIINLSQVLYIQLNLLFFAYCSRIYRATLMKCLRAVAGFFRCCFTCRRRRRKEDIEQPRRKPEDSNIQFIYMNKIAEP